mmetsp:Transcript_54582/g.152281  ORF Transcript_54582/g.152281 Transcript_54582/m.152281 type:complete len:295 (+) Transcript_54582:34-918(+)
MAYTGGVLQDDGAEGLAPAEWVKELQKTSPDGKARWHAFCDLHNGGKFDPHRASEETLLAFIEQEQNGIDPRDNLSAFEQLLVQVKEGQRTDPNFKEAWAVHCMQHGQGIRDPARHDEASLRLFLESMGVPVQGASQNGGGAGKGGGGCRRTCAGNFGKATGKMGNGGDLPWAKAAGGKATAGKGTMFGGAGAGGKNAWGMSEQVKPQFAGTPVKGAAPDSVAVELVKYGQRHSESFRMAWQKHCAAYSAGVRDPNQLGEDFIKGFLDCMSGAYFGVIEAQFQDGSLPKRQRVR